MTAPAAAGIAPPRPGPTAAAPVALLEIHDAGTTVSLSPQADPLPPAPGQCRLWRLPLAVSPPLVSLLETLLCEDERHRANAFKVPVPRRHFIVTRAVLRLLLSRILDIPASASRFEYGEFGKPQLSHPESSLRFNVSHSGEQALFGFSEGIDIGVDLEHQRLLPDLESLAATILSPHEFTRWQRLPLAGRTAAFHDAWARKEAVIKAVGAGLSLDLHSLEVGFLPDEPSRVLQIDEALGPPAAWSLLPLEVGAGYSATVAARVPDLRLV